MTISDAYEALAGRLGFPGSALLRSILESLMTPEQAALVETLPGTAEEVAEKAGISVAEARRQLDALYYAGVVYPRGAFDKRDYYRFVRHIIQLHDATLGSQHRDVVKDHAFFEKWQAFCTEEMFARLGAMFRIVPTRISRIIPARKALAGLTDVLPCEDYHEILKAQTLIAVVPCACRMRTTAAGELCAHTVETETSHCLQFGRGAEYVIHRGTGRPLTLDQALALCDQIEEDGLVHRWANKAEMLNVNTSCNCCRDCCEEWVSLDVTDMPVADWWEKSRYEAYVDDLDSCSGCQDCLERCQFDAITMYRDDNNNLKAAIEKSKCFGCGACVVGCPYGSLKLRAVRPPDFIPGAVD